MLHCTRRGAGSTVHVHLPIATLQARHRHMHDHTNWLAGWPCIDSDSILCEEFPVLSVYTWTVALTITLL